jgi:PBSX family phage terminase large subunit
LNKITAAQGEFIKYSTEGLNLARGSIGSGKTTALVIRFIGFLINEALPGKDILITARTKDLIEKNLFGPMREVAEENGMLAAFDFRTNPYRMKFGPKKIECFCAGANDDRAEERIRGMNVQCWLGNEVTLYPENFYNQCISRLRVGKKLGLLDCNPDSTVHYIYRKWVLPGRVQEFKFNIVDNPYVDQEYRDRVAAQYTGIYYRRFIEGEWGGAEEKMVVPEYFSCRDDIYQDWPMPAEYIPVMAMDVGWRDFTFLLFGYYDFKNDMIVIDDEVVIKYKMNTDLLVQMIKEKEQDLWGRESSLRFTDIDLRLIEDLGTMYNMALIPVRKDKEKTIAVNYLRVLVANKKLRINKRCVELDKHLLGAFWNDRFTTYERSEECGHFDGVDALIYFVRSITKQNPYSPQGRRRDNFYLDENENKESKWRKLLQPSFDEE